MISPLAGVRVSPLQLGAMGIGDKWHEFGMGSIDKTNSFKLLDAYFDAGGNIIDTANHYQDESSEAFIGEWAEKRGIRDQLVIVTKSDVTHMVMNSLHALVQQEKVLYLGISDSPAWVVPKANQYTKDHGKTPFSGYQGSWSVFERSFERDIIPMARAEGLALAPWGVLAGGKIRTNPEEARRKESGEKECTLEQKKVCDVLEEIAKEVVAIAYHLHKLPYVFPIIGGRKVEHLKENIAGHFPDRRADQAHRGDDTTDNYVAQCTAHCDHVPLQQPITPAKQQ
ncbi:NADP-dependent oxidoreductase domain-containing protein [Lactarius deliciosus]|nr:NADP-dependent oxidoreductase domain-containing protein [Lactarius deliciosus]